MLYCQVFEMQGRFPGREQIRADEKAHEVPGGYVKPVLEGVEFFPINGLETEHHALGFAGIGCRQKLLEFGGAGNKHGGGLKFLYLFHYQVDDDMGLETPFPVKGGAGSQLVHEADREGNFLAGIESITHGGPLLLKTWRLIPV
jgi:hypothetical protein